MTWGTARKKPLEVLFREVKPKELIRIKHPGHIEVWGEIIETEEGLLFAYPDKNFIIQGIADEVYPIDKEIFYETYDILQPCISKETETCSK